MSRVCFKLSELVSNKFNQDLERLTSKIENCGNDKLEIIAENHISKALIDYIKSIHITNDNKSVSIILKVKSPISSYKKGKN